MNKIVLIGSLLVGFQANVEQKILPFFRFVQRLLLSAMFIVGLSITPINAAVIQVSFTGPTFDSVVNNEFFDDGRTFEQGVDKVSGFFSFNDDGLIADKFDNSIQTCGSNCFDVNNFRASAGLISIRDSDENAALSGRIIYRNGVLVYIYVSYKNGDYAKIGDQRMDITYAWGEANNAELFTTARIDECARVLIGRGCNHFTDTLDSKRSTAKGSDPTFSLTEAILDGYVGAPVFAVSEPSIIALFTLGLVGIGFARRRRS